MILQSLCNYYARMIRDPANGMPPPGFSAEKISFALSLRPDGTLARVLDLREDGKKKKARIIRVPSGVKRSSGIAPNYLWDNTGYVLGREGKGKPERARAMFAAFKELHEQAAERSGDAMLRAVASFLRNWSPEQFDSLPGVDPKDMLDTNCVFMWDETGEYIHDQPGTLRPSGEVGEDGDWCLVSGRKGRAAQLHPAIKGMWGGQSSGGSLVSFNLDAFTSYGKEQGLNAPVSEEAAEAYTSALNYLLNRANRRCVQIGDASTVFWAEEPNPGEELLYTLLGGSGSTASGADTEEDEGESAREYHTAEAVSGLLQSLVMGRSVEEALPDIPSDTRFFILGLAPNAARIAVRFWLVTTFGDLARNTALHQQHIGIERQYDNQPEFPTLWQLMVSTAALGKSDRISPPLAAGLARAVLGGGPYPHDLLMAAISRIRAERDVTYFRAALIKGCLVRNYHQEVQPMLDTTRRDAPYLLGRLFALLEKVQYEALGNINAGVKDKYIGSASTTPALVFPRLLHMAQYHITKAEYGGFVENRMAEVLDDVTDFPAHLDVQEQGAFFLGYYQQRNANYRKTVREEE